MLIISYHHAHPTEKQNWVDYLCYLEHIALPYVKSECKLKWFNEG